ncbi:two-component system QseEF-associated lipoprotein QseG [Providencia vermicola]|uniref:Two-component system QseEF-associated lipoprotein QseG n=2 Tax=Providencia TaxID=586 RepID=A0AAI9MUX7_PROST|nr:MULTISPECIES: two-component system QseEF-associated lipoprotein QseG [Providencia]ELR5042946.1 two-component system QseEF-associated lipoprotein QseG [Providencia rettgeri]ELR5035228.1 two-component system QseEF-associated lipoprotein QseG [Providencia stuartii]ELR5121614.1 two-component system QseEF-associated lipoprotein QseG [Providencia stuartii]ELR5141136.1 two-component system QseEF-associated lipoprotein QseG [Providencia stuartii]ELR5290515.1 two-component system QseEF-associated li
MANRSTDVLTALHLTMLSKRYIELTKKTTTFIQKRKTVQLGALLLSLILTGCATKSGQSPLDTLAQVVVPEVKVTDYRYADCHGIWDNQQQSARENALFWLRMMDCADRLDPKTARAQALQLSIDNWSNAFQQSILMGAAEPSIAERRKMVDSMNTFSLNFPTAIRPLLQLWREQQVQIINLAEANSRFKRLQQETDNKLDRMKEENARLLFELDTTSRKLENLTDIERQLSSRKQNTNETEKEVEAVDKNQAKEAVKVEKPVTESENSTTNNQLESERNDQP